MILLFGQWRDLRDGSGLVASALTLWAALRVLEGVQGGKVLQCPLFSALPGLQVVLRADPMGTIFLLLTSSLWLVISLYSIGYMRALGEHAQTRFFFCFTLAIFSAIGVALSGNLLTLFFFYEVLTVSTFPLVGHEEGPEAIRASRKYLAYLLSGASLALLAILYTWGLAGTLDFRPGGFLGAGGGTLLLLLAFVIGFGSKAALMPFHEWLPSAMVAPTPVSALLHAVAVVKAGVFAVLRVLLYVFGPGALSAMGVSLPLGAFVAVTVIGANLLALREEHLKRRLAFSTINNLAVIILGALLLSEDGIRGALLHIPFHGFMKITLFMAAGAIYCQTGKEYVGEMDGVGRQMPLTMAAFTVAALGLSGIPPLCGFLSKWFLCLGALEAGHYLFLGVFLLSSFLDAAYFMPIAYRAFFHKGEGGFREAPWTMTIPILATALGSAILGLFPNWAFGFWDLAQEVARVVGGG